MQAAALCDICIACLSRDQACLTAKVNNLSVPLDHHLNRQSLERSSKSGCPICSRLRSLRPQSWAVNSNITPLTKLKLQRRRQGAYAGRLTATYLEATPDEEVRYCLREIHTNERYDAPIHYESWTGAPSLITLALQWSNRCNLHHAKCNLSQRSPWYPTRLIDVGVQAQECIHLIETSRIRPNGRYLTLSHRWGGTVTARLLKTTSVTLKEGFSVANLPLVFQHAIMVTRQLGERYIWIDSLCIFQDEDDRSDWEKEASLMEKVYYHGWINISATGAADDSEGLFRQRKMQSELLPIRLTCALPSITSKTTLKSYVADEDRLLRRSLYDSPLLRRAWVFQERFLSPRILHFGAQQLFWECNESTLCERYPREIPARLTNGGKAKSKSNDIYSTVHHFDISPTATLEPLPSWFTFLLLWRRIVSAYTATDITFDSDRTIALSGIVKTLRDAYQHEYVAGLWRNRLETQLLWRVHHASNQHGRVARRPTSYRAPSWSWLSLEAQIDASPPSLTRYDFHIIEVSLQHSTSDTTGGIKSGTLTLQGKLRSFAMVSRDTQAPSRQHAGWRLVVGERHADRVLCRIDCPEDLSNVDPSRRRAQLFLISAGTIERNTRRWLLLLKCVDPHRGIYERVGIACLNGQLPENEAMMHELQQTPEDVDSYPCVSYDAKTSLHTFVVV